jgi:HEAT repeat protein
LGAFGVAASPAVPKLLEILQSATREPAISNRTVGGRRWMVDPYDELRWSIALALGRIGAQADEAVPLLIDLLGAEDPNTAERAAIGLAWFRAEARLAIPALRSIAATDEGGRDKEVRIALIMIEPPDAAGVDWLVQTIREDGDDNSARFAIEALGRLGSEARSALPFLRERERGPFEGLRNNVREAIERIENGGREGAGHGQPVHPVE